MLLFCVPKPFSNFLPIPRTSVARNERCFEVPMILTLLKFGTLEEIRQTWIGNYEDLRTDTTAGAEPVGTRGTYYPTQNIGKKERKDESMEERKKKKNEQCGKVKLSLFMCRNRDACCKSYLRIFSLFQTNGSKKKFTFPPLLSTPPKKIS